MSDTTIQQANIITAALNAATFDEALGVVDLLTQAGATFRRPVGDKYNNFGLLASSGSYEYKALEPVTNEQDAVIERLALKRWGSLSAVPYTSPREASSDLLKGVNYQDQAEMVTVTLRESDEPAKSTKRLTIVYRDQGCGMTPESIPTTIFALGSSHKTGSRWQQGAFGIGGASTYRNALAVVLVTRRDPELNEGLEDRISVTVMVWEANGKAQSALYLVTTDWDAGEPGLPWSAPASSYPDFEPGTHLALVSYGVDGFQVPRSGDDRSFDTVLNTRLYEPMTPVRFVNEITRGKTEYLRGLLRRFEDNPRKDRSSDEEQLDFLFEGKKYRLPVRYYVFPVGDAGAKRRFVAKNHAVVFLSNGQVHHHWTPADVRFRTSLNKLYDRIFVTVDTDNLPIEFRTALFTPDRSQLLANEPALKLERQVAEHLNTWPALNAINSQLVREAMTAASGGTSTLDISKRISAALKVKGFGAGGLGTSGSSPTGVGGARTRKKVETYPDPTTLEGPDRAILQVDTVRYLEYMLNAVDDFLDSARGTLAFETDHPSIDPNEISVGKLRDGYVRVQIHIPAGADEGVFTLVARLTDWQKAAGGMGPDLRYETQLEILEELPPRGGAGGGNGSKGAQEGNSVALKWTTPEDYGDELHNGMPGLVEQLKAIDVAADPDYAELASLGDQMIPTIFLNSRYAPFKAYIEARARTLTDVGTKDAKDRYAAGVGLGLLAMHQDSEQYALKHGEVMPVETMIAAGMSVAKAVLFMMPEFDKLARESGIEASEE